MTRSTVELPLVARAAGPLPMGAQVAAQLREAMTDGRLAAGERLPATRVLAASLGVSRTVITSAYAQLFAEGWIEGRHGSGTFVADGAPPVADLPEAVPAGSRRAVAEPAVVPGVDGGAAPAAVPGPAGPAPARVAAPGAALAAAAGDGRPPPGSGLIDLTQGVPWAAGIDQAAWRRAWRQAGHQPPGGLAVPAGLPELRQAVTGYLRRGRAVHCTAGQVVITRGVAGGLALLSATLLRPGDLVGVEEPGYRKAGAIFAARGARVVPCRADRDGLVVSELPAGLRLVYTTPAHQYPLGGRLPVPRRQALVAWARATGALIVEDDYDGEFRYDVAPLPALFGLDPEVVVYLGTTSKTLTPGLATGWLVAAPGLAAQLALAAEGVGDRAGEQAQRAVHAFITSGDLERHIRRMRHEYARRRAAVVRLLGGSAAGGSPEGDAAAGGLLGDTAGMHTVVELPPARAARVAGAAREGGVAVETLDRYFAGPPDRGGLVLGYGGACLEDVARGCQVLAQILRTPDASGAHR